MNKIILIGTTSSMMIQFRQDLIKILHEHGWSVYAFVCEYTSNDLEKLKALGAIPVTYSMSRGGLNPIADIRSLMELRKKIILIKPDIVFSFFTKPVIYGTWASKLAGVKSINGMIEGLGTPFTIGPNGQGFKINLIKQIQIMLYRLSFPFLDKILFLNPDDSKDLVQQYKIKTKENAVQLLGAIGLNLDYYHYIPWVEQPIRFIFVARLLAEKGIFDYINAAKIVKKHHPNAIFTVIGGLDKENPHALTEDQLSDLVQEGVIDYPGFVHNVPDYLAKSAAFVLPSYYREGVPRSTQEAMAIGRPIITTDVPGCRETVIDGINGFLVPKWQPEALAEKMMYFIEHPDKINEMGQASRKMAEEKFDAKKVNAKLCKLLGIESTH